MAGHALALLLAVLCALAGAEVLTPKKDLAPKKHGSDDSCMNCCSEHGTCEKGQCRCDIGFFGPACNVRSCANPETQQVCSGHGLCDNVTLSCVCDKGYKGVACMLSAESLCYTLKGKVCSGHGYCDFGACQCSKGFSGVGCERDDEMQAKCNNDKYLNPTQKFLHNTPCRRNYTDEEDCSAHGQCNERTRNCDCFEGWAGPFCDIPPCPNECSNHGKCTFNSTGSHCACDNNWFGEDCSSGCVNGCSGNGECLSEDGAFKCKCLEGYGGSDCSIGICVPPCGGGGRCQITTTGGSNGEPVKITGRKCICADGYGGADCSHRRCERESYCKNDGKCRDHGCVCAKGWTGDFCDKQACDVMEGPKSNCSRHGACQDDGSCLCAPHYSGSFCEARWCSGNPNAPADCNGHGQCMDAASGDVTCKCDEGYKGILCEMKECPADCSGHGFCSKDGTCSCANNYTGSSCERLSCPKFDGQECSGPENGKCDGKGMCVCLPGQVGSACQSKPCQDDCNGHGSCSRDGACQCFCDNALGCYVGETCASRACPSALGKMCGGRGSCVNHQCICFSPYSGFACESNVCPYSQAPGKNGSSVKQCAGHGKCDFEKGICTCENGWNGAGCEAKSCPQDCGGHGFCNKTTGYCYCDEGYAGADCLSASCPNNCHARGTCVNGKCNCKAGWWREDCGERTCKDDCSMNGVCSDGECLCNPGRAGAACELVSVCPRNCSGHGTCKPGSKMGQCDCAAGWCGADCLTKLCPNDCNGHGECRNGTCACFFKDEQPKQCNLQQPDEKCATWFQDDCSELTCPFKCSQHGKCDNGTCRCNPPYAGPYCATYCDPQNSFFCNGLCDKTCKNKTRVMSGMSSETGVASPGLDQCQKVCVPKCLEKIFSDLEPPKMECVQALLKPLREKKQLRKHTAVHAAAEGIAGDLAGIIESKPAAGADNQVDAASL